MSSPQPPDYFVQGSDQRQYPADFAALQEWIRQGKVRPDHLVFIIAEQRWVHVSELPQLAHTAAPAPPPVRKTTSYKPLAIGCALLFVIFGGSFTVLYVVGSRVQEREAREAAAKKVREEQDLRRRVAEAATKLVRQLDEHDEALRKGDLTAADTAVRRAANVVQPFLALKPVPPELADILPRYEGAKRNTDLREQLLKEYGDLVKTQDEATRLATADKPADAEKILKTAQQTAGQLIEKTRDAEGLVMPGDFQPATRRKEIEKTLRNVSKNAEEQRKEEREAAAFAALCGDKPICGGFDGGCYQIESALKRTAHDPGSIDVEDCTEPMLYRDSCWVTTCNVRGRNAFGALVLVRKRFSISKLGVEEIP